MKDDRNFQLLDQNNGILWKSSSDSTDTLVPGQELNSNYAYIHDKENSTSHVECLTFIYKKMSMDFSLTL